MNHTAVSVKFLFLQQKQCHTRKAAGRPSLSPTPPSAASWGALRQPARPSPRPLLSHRPRAAPGSTCTPRSLTPCELSAAFGAQSRCSVPFPGTLLGVFLLPSLCGPSPEAGGVGCTLAVAVRIGAQVFIRDGTKPVCPAALLTPRVPVLVLLVSFFSNWFFSEAVTFLGRV